MRPLLLLFAALAACSPVEPRDAGVDRRSPRPDTGAEDVADELEPVVFDVQPIDARTDDALDASAPMDAPDAIDARPDSAPDSMPDARDAGVDAPDVFRVCPEPGHPSFETVPCRDRCCGNWEMCVVDGESTRCEVRVCPLYPSYPSRTLRCNRDCCDPSTEECVSDASGLHCRRRVCPDDPRIPTATQRCGRSCCQTSQSCNAGGTYPVSPMGERFCG